MSTVLLATARVRVADRFGCFHIARALLDQGSEASLISESLVQRLKLPRSYSSISIFGVGGKLTGSARGQVNVELTARVGGSPRMVSALILPRLTLYDGGIRTTQRAWKHLAGLELADPDFLAADPVDLLLGADVYADILQSGLRRGGPLEPIAQETSLGWILSGAVKSGSAASSSHTHQCHVSEDLSDVVRKFWQQEEMITSAVSLSSDDQEAEDHYTRTHYHNDDGRYVVRLPISTPLPDLTETRHSAARLLKQMEKRFVCDSQLRQQYFDFMHQYEDLGHMSPVISPRSESGFVCFLPHHGVMRPASSSTKLRVVFNGSSLIANGECLNRHLRIGLNLLLCLADVLLRWRLHRYVLASDIEKMYRQIQVDPADRSLHIMAIL